jgi:hypothetical protein
MCEQGCCLLTRHCHREDARDLGEIIKFECLRLIEANDWHEKAARNDYR